MDECTLKNKASTIKSDAKELFILEILRYLKKMCPGVFGTIKPVGYCMIGQK